MLGICLADTFSFSALGVINTLIMDQEGEYTFLWFFLYLTICSLLLVVVTLNIGITQGQEDTSVAANKTTRDNIEAQQQQPGTTEASNI